MCYTNKSGFNVIKLSRVLEKDLLLIRSQKTLPLERHTSSTDWDEDKLKMAMKFKRIKQKSLHDKLNALVRAPGGDFPGAANWNDTSSQHSTALAGISSLKRGRWTPWMNYDKQLM